MITGGNGQLGSEWVYYLNKQGVEFIALPSSDLDITDHSDVRRVLNNLRPDLIINCAAYTKVDQAEDEREKAFAVNADGVKNLADYCAEHKIKLVHFSTDYVFEGSEQDKKRLPDGYPEDHPAKPISVYGESKFAGEVSIQNSGCDYLIVRVSWLCGRFGKNFVKSMVRLGKERDELKVVNDQFGSPTFADNVVENCWHLIDQNISGLYHITSRGMITWYDLAQAIFKKTGEQVVVKPISSSEFPTKAKRPAFSLLSTKKIAAVPGITIMDWQEGLHNLLANIDT
jgi:dTDP-4-dehydrorhamnose reductase